MFSGIFGIPLVLSGTFFIGGLMLRLVSTMLRRHQDWEEWSKGQKYRARVLVSFVLFLLFFAHCVAIYSWKEQWSVMDAAYYVFVCYSTIGFGDFVPLE